MLTIWETMIVVIKAMTMIGIIIIEAMNIFMNNISVGIKAIISGKNISQMVSVDILVSMDRM